MSRTAPVLLVADAGPLIALAVAGLLPDALALFQTLWVPQAVLSECLADPGAPGAQAIQTAHRAGGFKLVPDNDIAPLDPAYAQGLGTGEVAVLAYAAQRGLTALIDDRRGRRVAERLRVPVTGSGAMLLALKTHGRLHSVQPALAAWRAHGYFISEAIATDILRRAGEA